MPITTLYETTVVGRLFNFTADQIRDPGHAVLHARLSSFITQQAFLLPTPLP